jgi:hypothetical protein
VRTAGRLPSRARRPAGSPQATAEAGYHWGPGYNWGMARQRYDEQRLRAALTATGAILRDRYGAGAPAGPQVSGPGGGQAAAGTDLPAAVLAGVLRIDDLARTRGEEPPHDRGALRVAVAELARRLADRAPGHSVELRVPPYLAVQVVPGPAHSRGTPPNVVETDPLTWLRVATGRTAWQDAVRSGRLSASGERADLSGYLPLG